MIELTASIVKAHRIENMTSFRLSCLFKKLVFRGQESECGRAEEIGDLAFLKTQIESLSLCEEERAQEDNRQILRRLL